MIASKSNTEPSHWAALPASERNGLRRFAMHMEIVNANARMERLQGVTLSALSDRAVQIAKTIEGMQDQLMKLRLEAGEIAMLLSDWEIENC